MKILLLHLFFALAAVCMLCGCTGPKVIVGGMEYDALSDDEIDRLCYLAELYLKNNVPNVVTHAEARQLERFLPVCNIQYNGDRSGRAVVRWELSQRIIEVIFDGKLLTPSAKCWVQTEEKSPEVIDFTQKGTLQKQQIKIGNSETPPQPKRSKRAKRR